MSRMSELPPTKYPASPGFRDLTTSRDAAMAVRPRVSDLGRRIVEILLYRPMTPDEAANEMGLTLLTIRPRFSELSKLGLIERTGERRANASGLKAHVWRKAL